MRPGQSHGRLSGLYSKGTALSPYQLAAAENLLSMQDLGVPARAVFPSRPHPDRTERHSLHLLRPRERFLTPAEVRALGEALVQVETVGLPPAPNRRRKPAVGPTAKHRTKSSEVPKPSNPYAVAAIRFLLLSGFREKEALSLRWDAVDLERKVAVLADTKTGRSVRRLGAPAVLVLESLPKVKGSPYVFPGTRPGKHLVEINRVWYAVRHAAGLDDVRLHDLRHSFASAVASAGGSLLMIRSLLGHKDTKTTAKYAHLLADPVQATADATAEDLAGLLGHLPRVAAVRRK